MCKIHENFGKKGLDDEQGSPGDIIWSLITKLLLLLEKHRVCTDGKHVS